MVIYIVSQGLPPEILINYKRGEEPHSLEQSVRHNFKQVMEVSMETQRGAIACHPVGCVEKNTASLL